MLAVYLPVVLASLLLALFSQAPYVRRSSRGYNLGLFIGFPVAVLFEITLWAATGNLLFMAISMLLIRSCMCLYGFRRLRPETPIAFYSPQPNMVLELFRRRPVLWTLPVGEAFGWAGTLLMITALLTGLIGRAGLPVSVALIAFAVIRMTTFSRKRSRRLSHLKRAGIEPHLDVAWLRLVYKTCELVGTRPTCQLLCVPSGIAGLEERDEDLLLYSWLALAADPTVVDAYRSLGVGYTRKGEREKARAVYALGEEVAPNDFALAGELGDLELDAGNYSEAERQYRRSQSLEPKHYYTAQLHLKLAVALEKQGRDPEAEAEARLAMELGGQRPDFQQQLWELRQKPGARVLGTD